MSIRCREEFRRESRIGLHETQLLQSPLQGGWREESLGDGEASQVFEGHLHF